ncbi:hypothetical protein LINPERPRIM_LOCUS38082 [Linum perenne]
MSFSQAHTKLLYSHNIPTKSPNPNKTKIIDHPCSGTRPAAQPNHRSPKADCRLGTSLFSTPSNFSHHRRHLRLLHLSSTTTIQCLVEDLFGVVDHAAGGAPVEVGPSLSGLTEQIGELFDFGFELNALLL